MTSSVRGRSLGRRFDWLWGAFVVSTYGTWLGFGAFAIIAIRVLHEGPLQIALLSSVGLAAGALLAVPLGPWIEYRHKLPVLVGADLVRFGALATLPLAYLLGALTFAQLLLVSVVVAAARIVFAAASGAYLKTIVPPTDLLTANGRFESANWSASVVGPALGGALIGLLSPLITICVDAASYVLSAGAIAAIGRDEEGPPARAPRRRVADISAGWRYVWASPTLRPLLTNAVLVNGLIMAGESPLAVLMLRDLHFSTWQYGVAFSVPCIGGLIGSRLARPMTDRFGRRAMLLGLGTLRACWPIGLVFVGPGVGGLATVIIVELGLIVCCAMFGPVSTSYRQQQTPADRMSRVGAAWSISTSLSIAAMTAAWGVLAALSSPRAALAAAGILLLLTPLTLLVPAHRSEKAWAPSMMVSARRADDDSP